MKPYIYLTIIACAGMLAGCAASIPPAELVNARKAYRRASAGQAARLVRAELQNARIALAVAERSFQEDPASFRTRDLASAADLKARMADSAATTAVGNLLAAKANREFRATQAEILKNTREDPGSSERGGVFKAAPVAAESRAAEAKADLAKRAALKEDAHGLVVTLWGSVLFSSNGATLLTAAQTRLNQVSDVLLADKERNVVVEGHMDSWGSSVRNRELSQQRADAVRTYIISRGYPAGLIQAKGIGEDRPVADNASVEGRANNQRVEIIVIAQPAKNEELTRR